MYFYGSFLTQSGETVTVHIVTGNSREQQVEIGGEGSGIFFTTDPVEIESSVNDTFDHLLHNQATIRLLTRDFIPDFFTPSCTDAVVNIFKGDRCMFAGFIEPQVYSQNYNELYDELELSGIDVLSALQYSRYRDVGRAGVDYQAIKMNAGQRSFADIINELLSLINYTDITGGHATEILYDGSKAMTASGERFGIFNDMYLSELLFLGDEEDDVWQQDEILENMLKYLNLHIIQEGFKFYIFSWETLLSGKRIEWSNRSFTQPAEVEINLANAAGADTSFSIGEIYNQISLTCKVEGVERLITSPLDSDCLTSSYSNKQLYMTEYSSDGEGVRAINAFGDMITGKETDYENAVVTDWYIQVRDNTQWLFPESGTGKNLIEEYCRDNSDQQTLPNKFPAESASAIFSLGKVVKKMDKKDNSPVSKIDMDDYLVVSVNGNGKNGELECYPNADTLLRDAPRAVYTGGTSGCVFSPADDVTTNYIVLSGDIILNPVMEFTASFASLEQNPWPTPPSWNPIWHKTVPSRTNGDGRYYTQKYYKAATPSDEPVVDRGVVRGLVPFTETGEQLYEFKYSAIGDGTDTISKVAVLACMLIIGDKCVVETGTQGQTSDFEWRQYKPREECADDEEYYQQCFTIGFDPKIGDELIGTSFKFQNNISYQLGLDTEGIAIPIRKSDCVSGKVQFIILGPVNTLWGDISRRHKTWFRSTKWTEKSVPLLAHVSSIFLKSFEVKVFSDNGFVSNEDNNDIVYVSDAHPAFLNEKDDITFNISSALTSEECRELGVSNGVNLSTPSDGEGLGVVNIYDRHRGVQAKPEQLYVDSYYTEYHAPRVIMTQKITDSDDRVSLFNHFIHPALGKRFFVQSISRNLIEGYAELTLKEIWND